VADDVHAGRRASKVPPRRPRVLSRTDLRLLSAAPSESRSLTPVKSSRGLLMPKPLRGGQRGRFRDCISLCSSGVNAYESLHTQSAFGRSGADVGVEFAGFRAHNSRSRSRPQVLAVARYNILKNRVPGISPLPHIALGRKKLVRRAALEAWKRVNENNASATLGTEPVINTVDA